MADEVAAEANDIRRVADEITKTSGQAKRPAQFDDIQKLTPANFQEHLDLIDALKGADTSLGKWFDGLSGTMKYSSKFMVSFADQLQQLDKLHGTQLEDQVHKIGQDVANTPAPVTDQSGQQSSATPDASDQPSTTTTPSSVTTT